MLDEKRRRTLSAGKDMPAKIILDVTDGPLKGQRFSFEEHDTFLFGRAEDCHARLPGEDPSASRNHFLLEVNPPQARIRDLGSLNGTYINEVKFGGRAAHEGPESSAGRASPEVDIKHGDRIRVGSTVFAVRIEELVACCRCRGVIQADETEFLGWTGGTFLCLDCRRTAIEVRRRPKVPDPTRCKQCGTAEVLAGHRGVFICSRCQKTVVKNPGAAVFEKVIREGSAQRMLPDIGDYQLGKLLGEGGMGQVYLARRRSDGLVVALKVMLAHVEVSESARQLFLREIEVMMRLNHPHVVPLLDHGADGRRFFFALEYCPGGDLGGLLQRHGGLLPLQQAGKIMLQLLDGLAYAHGRGLVHRDIKPANALLTAPDEGLAKLSDFGLAKSFQQAGLSGMTVTGSMAGTPPFMPREQLINFKYVKPASDVWSMGAMLYHLLTGVFPRDFPPGEDPLPVVLRAPIVPILQRAPHLPRQVAEVIDQALHADVKSRYPSAAEFKQDLERVL